MEENLHPENKYGEGAALEGNDEKQRIINKLDRIESLLHAFRKKEHRGKNMSVMEILRANMEADPDLANVLDELIEELEEDLQYAPNDPTNPDMVLLFQDLDEGERMVRVVEFRALLRNFLNYEEEDVKWMRDPDRTKFIEDVFRYLKERELIKQKKLKRKNGDGGK